MKPGFRHLYDSGAFRTFQVILEFIFGGDGKFQGYEMQGNAVLGEGQSELLCKLNTLIEYAGGVSKSDGLIIYIKSGDTNPWYNRII